MLILAGTLIAGALVLSAVLVALSPGRPRPFQDEAGRKLAILRDDVAAGARGHADP